LFIVAEDSKDADSIAERLRGEKEFKDKDRVPVIHIKGDSDIDTRIVDLLEAARRAARFPCPKPPYVRPLSIKNTQARARGWRNGGGRA
jgi:hypothetical protein